ncbi:uncharacterized protein LOC143301066 [Babylonia areolata]|uniref:uncharacterized protein LOC143301066 n=1 Tax=Babylonia areolata TaxID=304850 RepID=UPI003FD3844D
MPSDSGVPCYPAEKACYTQLQPVAANGLTFSGALIASSTKVCLAEPQDGVSGYPIALDPTSSTTTTTTTTTSSSPCSPSSSSYSYDSSSTTTTVPHCHPLYPQPLPPSCSSATFSSDPYYLPHDHLHHCSPRYKDETPSPPHGHPPSPESVFEDELSTIQEVLQPRITGKKGDDDDSSVMFDVTDLAFLDQDCLAQGGDPWQDDAPSSMCSSSVGHPGYYTSSTPSSSSSSHHTHQHQPYPPPPSSSSSSSSSTSSSSAFTPAGADHYAYVDPAYRTTPTPTTLRTTSSYHPYRSGHYLHLLHQHNPATWSLHFYDTATATATTVIHPCSSASSSSSASASASAAFSPAPSPPLSHLPRENYGVYYYNHHLHHQPHHHHHPHRLHHHHHHQQQQQQQQQHPVAAAMTTKTMVTTMRNDEEGEEELDDDDDPVYKPYCESRRGAKKNLLWKFLLTVLDNHADLAQWTDLKRGVFKFVDTASISKLWGQRKHKNDMTFEKLSRGIRHYYKRGLMERMPNTRLVYKFNWDKVPKKFRKA